MGFVYVFVFVFFVLPLLLAFSKKHQPKQSRRDGKTKSQDRGNIYIERFEDGHEIHYKIVKDMDRELTLVYLDREGSQTTRPVQALQLHKLSNTWYLFAFCRLREEKRHFRIGGIKQIVDHQTGEIVEKRFVEYLRSI
jgi:hypothetical protein